MLLQRRVIPSDGDSDVSINSAQAQAMETGKGERGAMRGYRRISVFEDSKKMGVPLAMIIRSK